MNTNRNHQIGQTVTYRALGGAQRTVKIDGIGTDGDMKDGYPTFDGTIISSTDRNDRAGDTVWGYVDDILY